MKIIENQHFQSISPLKKCATLASQPREFVRQNGPASAAPVQEGHFWKRTETKSEFFA